MINVAYTGNGTANTDILDSFELNQIIVEHEVTSQELLTIKEVTPDYADHIKKNLTSSVAERIIPKMTFTKSMNPDTDSHKFRGRVWVFNKDELEELIKKAKGY
jgi:hypothetical protein